MIWRLVAAAVVAGIGLYSLYIIATCVSVLTAVPLDIVVAVSVALFGVAALLLTRVVASLVESRQRIWRRGGRRWWV